MGVQPCGGGREARWLTSLNGPVGLFSWPSTVPAQQWFRHWRATRVPPSSPRHQSRERLGPEPVLEPDDVAGPVGLCPTLVRGAHAPCGVQIMQAAGRKAPATRARRRLKTTALIVSLFLSAFVMALSLGSPEGSWLGWFSLSPLFIAIRVLRPTRAMLAGGLWGLGLSVFLAAGVHDAAGPAWQFAVLLVAVPAIYAYLGARLAHSIGFSPLVLGVAWVGVELAFHPLGLRSGLLGGSTAHGTILGWVEGALGYVLVAFLIAYVNASLVAAFCGIRLRIGQFRFRVSLPVSGRSSAPPTSVCAFLFDVLPAHPRAPPV